MPPREWRLLIEDMVASIDTIQRHIRTGTRADFTRGSAIADAVLYNLMVIGEAASRVPTRS